jgi:hypothetical protein
MNNIRFISIINLIFLHFLLERPFLDCKILLWYILNIFTLYNYHDQHFLTFIFLNWKTVKLLLDWKRSQSWRTRFLRKLSASHCRQNRRRFDCATSHRQRSNRQFKELCRFVFYRFYWCCDLLRWSIKKKISVVWNWCWQATQSLENPGRGAQFFCQNPSEGQDFSGKILRGVTI